MKELFFVGCLFCLPFLGYGQIQNDSVHQAIEVFCDETISVNFEGADADLYTPFFGCNFVSDEPGVWYKIEGTGAIIQFFICDFWVEMVVFGGRPDSLICLEEQVQEYSYYQCQNNGAELGFKSEIGQTYYVYCNSYNSFLPSTLTVKCLNPLLNNSCETAIPIVLDSSYQLNHETAYDSQHPSCYENETAQPDSWYVVKGTGGILAYDNPFVFGQLSSGVKKGSCDNFECVTDLFELPNNLIGFRTEVGVDYYIEFKGSSTNNQSFSFTTFSAASNNACENALLYAITDTLEFTLRNAILDTGYCTHFRNFDLWYKFIGNDSIIEFEILEGGFNGPEVSVLSGTCDALICEPITAFERNRWTIKTQKGGSYFLNVHNQSFTDVQADFHLTTKSGIGVPNDKYTDAIELNCLDSLIGTLTNAQADKAINNRNEPSVWYKIIGQSEFVELKTSYIFDVAINIEPQIAFFAEKEGILNTNDISPYAPFFLEKDSILYVNIISRSFSNSFIDSFQISMECYSTLENDSCLNAIPINLTDSIQGSTAFAKATGESGCMESSTLPGVWYEFVGGGELVDFTFFTENKSHEFSISKGSCDSLDCVITFSHAFNTSESTTTRLYFEKDVSYYIKIHNDYSDWDTDKFNFYFKELTIATNDICATATPITCGSIINDSLDFAIANDTFCTPSSFYFNNSIWYSIEGNNQYIAFNFPNASFWDLNNQDFDLLRGTCDSLECQFYALQAYEGKMVFFAEQGKTYYFLGNNYLNTHFSVSCFEQPTNDSLSNNIPLVCGNTYQGFAFNQTSDTIASCSYDNNSIDIWFSIQGNDEFLYMLPNTIVKNYNDEIYIKENGQLTCIGFFQENRFFLEENKEYFIRVIFQVPSDFGADFDYDFTVTCHPKPPNNDCTNAVELSCGDSLEIDNTHTANDLTSYDCIDAAYRSLWYKFKGNNTWITLTIPQSEEEKNDPYKTVRFFLFEGNCMNPVCLTGNNVFYAEAGKEYLVYINYPLGKKRLSVSCNPPANNDFCEDATFISCGDTIRNTLDYATNCEKEAACFNDPIGKNVWYEFIGTGDIMKVALDFLAWDNYQGKLQIYEGDCCAKQKITTFYGENRNQFFATQKDKKYLVAVEMTDPPRDGRFILTLDCNTSEQISVCENALELSDNQTDSINFEKALNYVSKEGLRGKVAWIKFNGTGGIDTLSLQFPSPAGIQVHSFISEAASCQLSYYEDISIQVIFNENNELSLILPTVQGLQYVLALEIDFYNYTPNKNIALTLKPSITPNLCGILLPDTIYAQFLKPLFLPFEIYGDSSNFSVSLTDDTQTNSNYLHPTDSLFYIPRTTGLKVVTFNNEQCSSHGTTYVKITDLEEADNPDCLTIPTETIIKNSSKIKAYPNPSSTQITIEIDHPASKMDLSIQVFNIMGQQVSLPITSIDDNRFVLYKSKLETGIYFVQIRDNKTGLVLGNKKIIFQ